MKSGYPRFFIHKSIRKLSQCMLEKFGQPGEDAMLFPSPRVAARCRQFIKQASTTVPPPAVRIVELVSRTGILRGSGGGGGDAERLIWSDLCVVLFPAKEFGIAKQFWQHSGDGVSSRRAEFCQREFDEGLLVGKNAISEAAHVSKGPKRYSTGGKTQIRAQPKDEEGLDVFVDERFGRNLDVAFVDSAKLAIKRRIAGTLKSNVELKDALRLSNEGGRLEDGFSESDVYLHPTGMSAVFNTHRLLMATLGQKKSVCYGWVVYPPITDIF